MARGECRLNVLFYAPATIRDVQSAGKWLFKKTGTDRYGDELVAAIDIVGQRIARNPLIGRVYPGYDLRSFPVKKYRMFYRVEKDLVEVVRILHQRRDVTKPLRRWRRK